jgi:hypothetical protein
MQVTTSLKVDSFAIAKELKILLIAWDSNSAGPGEGLSWMMQASPCGTSPQSLLLLLE